MKLIIGLECIVNLISVAHHFNADRMGLWMDHLKSDKNVKKPRKSSINIEKSLLR